MNIVFEVGLPLWRQHWPAVGEECVVGPGILARVVCLWLDRDSFVVEVL